ncbi:MAG: heparinase II/III family protein [Sandaracinaceae bacterium]
MKQSYACAALLLLAACDGESPSDGGIPRDGAARLDAAGLDAAGRDAARPDAGPLVLGDHPRILLADRADVRARLTAAIGSTTGARFRSMVDRELATPGTIYAFRQSDAALLGVLTGEARYCEHAVAETDAYVTDEEARIAGGANAEVAGDSYLYVGDVVGDLALVYDWCADTVTEEQRDRWIAYANQAVWNVWHHDDAVWNGNAFPWSGWSVENPSNNYYYSFLEATMMLGLATDGENAMAADWLTQFRTTKIQGELVPTFERDLVGGGSREGTGYGTAMRRLFWLYDVWEASTGEPIADLTDHARSSLAYLMHATTPTLDRLAPTGDHARDSTAALFDYHRAYLLELIDLFPTAEAAGPAVSYLEACSVPEMGQPFQYLYDFLYDPTVTAAPLASLHTVYHAVGTGHLFARSAWTNDASYLAFIAGPYTESHAHQDQGSFVLFSGEWLAFDENVLSHSGIVQDTTVHNLVRLERGGAPLPMREGTTSTLRAVETDEELVYFSADTAPAYRDDSITRVLRRLVYVRPGVVVVDDRVTTTDASTAAIFAVNTPIDPTLTTGRATMTGARGRLDVFYALGASAPTETAWNAVDGAEYSGGFRVDARASATGDAHFVTVLGIDGAVSAASASSAGGTTTATVTTGAGTLSVAFPDDGGPPTVITASGRTVTFDDAIEPQPLLAP